MFVVQASLHVPEGHREALEARFRGRSRLVDGHDGFRRLQLLKGKGTDEYLLVLHWEDQASFRDYCKHEDFEHAHGDLDEAVEAGPLRQYEAILDSTEGG